MANVIIDAEPLNKDNLNRLIGQPESATLEFKREIDTEALVMNIAAFSNTEGGFLIVGVEDGGRIVGCNLPRLRQLVAQAAGKLSPSPSISLREFDFDGKGVGVVEVGKAMAAPVVADGSFFVRDGEKSRFALAHELAHLLVNWQEPDQITILVQAVANQSVQIMKMQEDLHKNNSWRTKTTDWIYAGIVGAIIALAFGWLVGLIGA